MKNQFNLNHAITISLTIVSILFLPLLFWGIRTETRFEQVIMNKKQSEKNEEDIKVIKDLIQENQIEVIKELGEVKVLIANKI
jgi:hypothetical protein